MTISTAVVDIEGLYTALDRERRQQRLKRSELAAILGVTPAVFSIWGQGGGISSAVALRACMWLDADIRQFAAQQEAPA